MAKYPVAAVRTAAITATGSNLTDTDPAQVEQDEHLSGPAAATMGHDANGADGEGLSAVAADSHPVAGAIAAAGSTEAASSPATGCESAATALRPSPSAPLAS